MSEETCDVAVIGGGPAGSTAATLLARRGYRVVALEKAHHPRFHIGESLLPMNLPVFERLGVAREGAGARSIQARCGFRGRQRARLQHLRFERAIGDSPPHAYQVWRQDFDQMLFEHARASGADRARGARGRRESSSSGRAIRGSRCAPTTAAAISIQARYVVDASGRDAFLSTQEEAAPQKREAPERGDLRPLPRGADSAGEDAGNISIYQLRVRLDVDDPAARRGDERRCRMPAGLPEAAQGLAAWSSCSRRSGATRRCGSACEQAELIGNEVRVTGNYSYDSHASMGGPGWILIGDAFAFLDPVFSSGVYLAMSGAEQAAQVVDTALREPARERALLRRLEKRLRTGMHRFSFFIYRFNSPVMQQIVPRAAQYAAARAGRDLDAGGRSVRHAPGAVATEAVQARLRFLGLLDLRRWHAEHRYRLAQARAQFSGGNTPLDRR